MIRFPLDGEDAKPDSAVNTIIENALGKAIVTDAQPTTTNNILSDGQVGFYSGSFYWKINGNTYRLTTTLV